MSDNQSGKTEMKRSTPGYILMIGAIGTALAIKMSVGSETHSQLVLNSGIRRLGSRAGCPQRADYAR